MSKDKKPKQLNLFGNPHTESEDEFDDVPSKLRFEDVTSKNANQSGQVDTLPPIFLPTRWEKLSPKIDNDNTTFRIIRPVLQAIRVIEKIVDYLAVTRGGQVFVIRGDTGSGKTTFLNTLSHYVGTNLHIQTIDIQPLTEDLFSEILWKTKISEDVVNLIILEGREKPEDISEKYIQVALSNINRFVRSSLSPILFVIPTIDEQVARRWCQHGETIGDLIPKSIMYDGARWYTFPGVSKSEYAQIAEETVRALNPPYMLSDYGILPEESKVWVDVSPTIGNYIEKIAGEISNRRQSTRISVTGRREHVWILYCAPDYKHFDHTYHMINGLASDSRLIPLPNKLVPDTSEDSEVKEWRQPSNWTNLLATLNFLDVRIINFPIITAVTSALAYGKNTLLDSFKSTAFETYKDEIEKAGFTLEEDIQWDELLADRRQQKQNAISSVERTNLFLLLKGMPASGQKGFRPEAIKEYAQYLHLRDHANESEIHLYIAKALQGLLEKHQFPGFLGVATEKPLIDGQSSPIPDITIYTEKDVYALEVHFFRKQFTTSEISRYALNRVIRKYMRGLPHLSSQLRIDTLDNE